MSNVWLRSSLGFDQGFEHFDEKSAMSEFYADGARVAWKNASDVSDAALTWLEIAPGGAVLSLAALPRSAPSLRAAAGIP